MAAIQQRPSPGRGLELIRYLANLLFAITVIVVGVKIAVDHWPCEFVSKLACAKERAQVQRLQQQVAGPVASNMAATPYPLSMANGAHQMLAAEIIRP
jgi:hypothetical protein